MSDGLVLIPLAPTGPFDYIAQIQPPYRNLVTGEEAELEKLCQTPGAVWHAFWMPNRPYLIRLGDGSIMHATLPDHLAMQVTAG